MNRATHAPDHQRPRRKLSLQRDTIRQLAPLMTAYGKFTSQKTCESTNTGAKCTQTDRANDCTVTVNSQNCPPETDVCTETDLCTNTDVCPLFR